MLSSLLCLLAYGQTDEVRSKPNVLFILVDDLRPELGSYGKSHMISPNIDRLAKKGQLFTRAYVNFPVCGPSRASLLSGLYPSRTRFKAWNCSQDNDVSGIVSLPMHFRNNNYTTVSLGKVYNNFDDGKGSWDEIWRPALTTTLWDYQTKAGVKLFEELNSERQEDPRPRNNTNLPKRGLAYENAEVEDIAYEDGRIANKAIEKLQEFQNSSEPFFMAVGFKKPHLPFNAPSKYWELYNEETINLAQNAYPPEDAPGISLPNFGELRAYYGIPEEGPLPDSLAIKLRHGYYACVSYVDKQIGRVLDELENLGLDENTIIVLWGDHGWQLGEHGLWGKNTNYEISLQIPLLVKIPKKKGNIRQEGLVETVDIYPTLCDLAALRKPFHLQGKSFASLLDNPDTRGKTVVYSRTGSGGETIITETHAYTAFFDKQGKVKAEMLYDLEKDHQENKNIAGQTENRELIKSLMAKLKIHMTERDRIIVP